MGDSARPAASGDSPSPSDFADVRPRVYGPGHIRDQADAILSPKVVPTGIDQLDNLLGGGLRPGGLYILAGSPGTGKSALAVQIAARGASWSAANNAAPVLLVNAERRMIDLASLLATQECGIAPSSDLAGPDEAAFRTALDLVGESRLTIVDSAASINEIGQIAGSEWFSRIGLSIAGWWPFGTSLIVIDPLASFSIDGDFSADAKVEMARVVNALKRLSIEQGTPVLLVSQLNRTPGIETRAPGLGDLPTGNMASTADVIVFLAAGADRGKGGDTPKADRIIAAKNRFGPTGSVNVNWDSSSLRFAGEQMSHSERTTGDRLAAKPKPDAAYLDSILPLDDIATAVVHKGRNPMEFTVGLDPFGGRVTSAADDPMHPMALVTGTTGSGKSVFLDTMLIQLMANNSPDDLEIAIFSPDRAFDDLAYAPHVWPLPTQGAGLRRQCGSLLAELERRKQMWEAASVVDLPSARAKMPSRALPRIIALFDEPTSFRKDKSLDGQVEVALNAILRLGRKYGIYGIVCVQRPTADNCGVGLMDNLGRRFVFRTESAAHSERVLDNDPAAAQLAGSGDGVYRVASDITRFRSLLVTSVPRGGHPAISDYIEAIAERWDAK
jgi:KaiC/GvpD/RAD55 family RecA-like ATPase